MNAAPALTFDDVFASSGFFGVELASGVSERDGDVVALRGYLYGPLVTGERDYVLSRSSLRYCPCCSGEPAYGDDLVAVRLREPLAPAAHDADREQCIEGVLAIGHRESGHPGLATALHLSDARITATAL
jgi:hypothetical protein